MKVNKFYIFAAGVALAMTSCGEGQYWDEASNPAEVYAFPKPAETMSVPADGVAPSTYEITVMRNTSGAAVTVPVIFSEVNSSGQEVSVGLLSGADEVTFPAGSNKAVYTINIADGLSAGTTYYAKISLEDPEVADNQTQVDVNPNNKTFTFSISQAINWTAAGTAEAVSEWVGRVITSSSMLMQTIMLQASRAGSQWVSSSRVMNSSSVAPHLWDAASLTMEMFTH